MTYARARLLVGITGVGVWVVAATVFLALGGAGLLPAAHSPIGTEVATLAVALAVYAVVSLPFDILGGLVLPRRHGRVAPTPARFVAAWLRGVVVQSVVMAAAVALIIVAGRAGGRGAAVGVVAALSVIIAIARLPMARLVAAIGAPRPLPGAHGVTVVTATDPGFTGGLVGARGRVVIPDAWREALGDALPIELARRGAHAGASYWLGILVAAGWTTAGAALALMLPGGGADGVGPMVATGAWFTLWSFIGLLVLPSISRPAVRAADAAAARSWPAAAVAGVISTLDARQDDEPERPGAIETIFHPIPGAASRISGLTSARPAVRPWHVARLALPMSWCCLGFLGRAVHCNAGRPELWVLLPAD